MNTSFIELFTQQHYTASIAPEANISPLWKDVFMFHWKEEVQHAILDELEWLREDANPTPHQRDRAASELTDPSTGNDSILQGQAAADVEYFTAIAGRGFTAEERRALDAGVLRAYRWQYIGSGVQHPHSLRLLSSLTTSTQMTRIGEALAPIVAS